MEWLASRQVFGEARLTGWAAEQALSLYAYHYTLSQGYKGFLLYLAKPDSASEFRPLVGLISGSLNLVEQYTPCFGACQPPLSKLTIHGPSAPGCEPR